MARPSAHAAWGALAAALAALLLMQIWAGSSLRGLYADGAYYAEQLLLRQSFDVIEPSRWTSQMLMQAPVVLAMAAGWTSPHAVALCLSLSTTLVPLLLTLPCLVLLPRGERHYALFPIFVFLAASMSAGFASVADGPTAAAYAWLLLLLIIFGPLTPWRLAAILLLAAGALRLHEATAFLGPILAFACLERGRSEGARLVRAILGLSAILILAGCAVAVYDVLHPRVAANRASFVQDLMGLRWLLLDSHHVNMTAAIGVVGLIMLPIIALPGRARTIAMAAAGSLLMALAVPALVVPPFPPGAFAARNNACLMTGPAMLLLLTVRRRRPALPGGLTVTATMLTAMLGITVAVADGADTAGWLSYTQAMTMALKDGRGVVPWETALAGLPPRQRQAMARYAWPWTTPLMSLWLAPGARIETIIANPPGYTWQPFDPEAMRPALAAADTPPSRSGFVALLDP
ncbi:MAG: hypothetical protein HIU92_05405 [Proteobacteria bacterium]|nr:hypothetical protein [Pseudomonadota bacterium]